MTAARALWHTRMAQELAGDSSTIFSSGLEPIFLCSRGKLNFLVIDIILPKFTFLYLVIDN